MAVTTEDAALAGFQPPNAIIKTGIATAAVGGMRGYSLRYAAGNPGASVAPTIGVNGEAVTASLNTPAGVVGGRIPRTNPVSGNAHVGRLAWNASTPGTLWLIDRLWHNSGLSTTLTTSQAITPAAIPARDRTGTTNGDDVLAALEWSTTGGAGTPTVTITYTDSDGNASNSGVLTAVTTPPVGTFELFTLAAGDRGVRSVQALIQSATRTSGAYSLVLFRVLAQVEITSANIGNAIDTLTGGMPRVYDNSVLELVWFPSATTATNFMGQYLETQG
jgi:hypothetical protein